MSKFSDLPIEIWLLIASYVPKSQLFHLKSLNGFFLDQWMDTNWNYVNIDTTKAVPLLLRVLDPFVTTRVKILSLRIFIDFGQSLSENESELTSLILSFLSLLSKTTFLRIVVSSQSIAFFSIIFRTVATSPLARTLQRLWVLGDSAMFASQLEYSAYTFENLSDFSITLWDSELPDLLEGTFPLRLLAPSLQTLHIATNWSGILDIFAPFNTLDSSVPFPILKFLHLRFASTSTLPFPKSLLQSFHRLILAHNNNLQDLYVSNMALIPNSVADEWLAGLVNNNTQFPSLEDLQLYPSDTRIGLSTFLTLIQRTVPTLSSLTIPDRYLTSEEVNQLLDVLAGGGSQVQTMATATGLIRNERQSKLKTLIIHITLLSVPLLDLLARKLPQLESLSLFVSEIVGSDQTTFYDLLHHRRYDQRDTTSSRDILHTWKLRSISIQDQNKDRLYDAMRAVAGALPCVSLPENRIV